MYKAPPVLCVPSPSGHLWIQRQCRTLLEASGASLPTQPQLPTGHLAPGWPCFFPQGPLLGQPPVMAFPYS